MRQYLRKLGGGVLALAVGAAWAAAPPAATQSAPAPAVAVSAPSPLDAALAGVSAARISDQVNFLSSDLLEGRAAGSDGAAIAAAYIATQFALHGLKPAADHGSYLQHVPLVNVTTDTSTQLNLAPASGAPIPLKYGDDVLVTDDADETSATLDAPIVFVGYGVTDTARHRDDYQGVDLHGKIALMFAGLPPSDGDHDDALAADGAGTPSAQFAAAERAGALGAILVYREDPSHASPWSRLRDHLRGGRNLPDSPDPDALHAAGWIHRDVARVLFAAAGLPMDQALSAADSDGFKPITLPVHLQGQIISLRRHFTSDNVLAWLPGREPGPPHQVVLYTAHYDHLGQYSGRDGVHIYNGAVNNASGVAMLLELAQALADAPQRPPHAMLFAATTAAEPGDLGAAYLAAHLPLRTKALALMLNFDTVPPIGLPEEVVVTNAARIRYTDVLREAAAALHLRVVPRAGAPAGGRGLQETLPFARLGVPALSINEGYKFAGHSREWGAAMLQDYHLQRDRQPSDHYRPEMNFTGNARLVRYGLALGWDAADKAAPIRWRSGDPFGQRRSGGDTP